MDPNAPAIDRIPLPELKDVDKIEKLKALRESAKRVTLNKDNLPSIILHTVLNDSDSVCSAEVSDDSSMLAIGFQDSFIRVWSISPKKLCTMKPIEQLKDVDKDSEDIIARMVDEKSGESTRTLYGHSGPVYRCTFSPEKHYLLSGSEDSTIRLWSLQTWSCMVLYKGHIYPVWDVRFSPYGYYFASGSYDKSVKVWATDNCQPLRTFCGHLADVDCVQFHPNSNYVASGSSDRTVRLWDIATAQMVRLMTGHKSTVLSLVFSTCGRYLASGAADKNVHIWDISNGQLVTVLMKHELTIQTMAFSRDGNLLAVGGMDCRLTLWDFAKLTEDYISNGGSNSSHNTDIIDGTKYLLRLYQSKNTPFLHLHFTRRNLLLAVGNFKSIKNEK